MKGTIENFNNPSPEKIHGKLSVTTSLLTPKDRRLLEETRKLLEEILETEAVLNDEALMKSIRESEEDVKARRVYSMDEMKDELKTKGKL